MSEDYIIDLEFLRKKAYYFAKLKHRGQKDDNDICSTDDGYFHNHCVVVADILKKLLSPYFDVISVEDNNLICAGYLHDTLEDTNTTYDELVREFNQDIADLVNEVTHEGKKDNKGYYFPRLKTRRGIMLKFADRLSNLNRINNWDIKRQEQYLKRSVFWRTE